MSSQARYFLRMWFGVLARLETPSPSPRVDREIYEDEHRVRILASDLIGWGCEPSAACPDLAEGLTPNFCQAGVVAPPDSPGFGKTVVEC